MNIIEIIAKKRDDHELNTEEINYFIKEYVSGNIPDYQAAALVMAMYINGMSGRETTDLTIAMANSGDTLDLSDIGDVVDKHSTGGVGDKVTLILMPVVASWGIPVAKMSGRGLGFTGGTIDKLEAIPGYNTAVELEEFKENVKKIGISLIGQTMNLAPADKKLYALRDSIGCTQNTALIASSIMSKKMAAGAKKIVIDVTCGKGAFMKNKLQALKLAEKMYRIGELANIKVKSVITDMNQPVGRSVGNILEVIEAIETLKGETMTHDLKHIVKELGANILVLANKAENIEEGKQMIMENIQNGKAYEKFKQLVENQGGDISYLEDTSKFEKAKYIEPIIAEKNGTVIGLDAYKVGMLSNYLGAGRNKKEDSINYKVGFVFEKKIGDEVKKGDTLGYIHADEIEKAEYVKAQKLFKIGYWRLYERRKFSRRYSS